MRATVLVVDDDFSVRKSLTRMLRVHGYDAIAARDGIEAVRKALDDNPQIILIDLHLPGRSGIETTQQLCAQAALQDVPIIALSASPVLNEDTAALFHQVLTKPCSSADLLRALEAALHR